MRQLTGLRLDDPDDVLAALGPDAAAISRAQLRDLLAARRTGSRRGADGAVAEQRVERAAEESLVAQEYVNAIDVLRGLGWLPSPRRVAAGKALDAGGDHAGREVASPT